MENEDAAGEAPAAPSEQARAEIPRVPPGWQQGQVANRYAQASPTTPASYDPRARSIEVVIATGYRVRRWWGFEELAVTQDAVDLRRVGLGQVRLLDSHNAYSRDAVLGVVTAARIENGALLGTVVFADNDEGRAAERDVASGALRGISAGYRINRIRLIEDGTEGEVYRAESWELLEVSLVSVPADPFASVRSIEGPSAPPSPLTPDRRGGHQMEPTMDEENAIDEAAAAAPTADTRAAQPAPAPAAAPATVDTGAAIRAERQRISAINAIAAQHRIGDEIVQRAIDDGSTVDAFRAVVLDTLAERSRAGGANGSPARPAPAEGRSSRMDETETRRRGMTDAIVARLARASGERVDLPEHARAFGEMGLAEMAAESIGHRGAIRTAAQVDDVFRRAFHTTSDFPALLMDAMNRRLLGRYQTATPTFRRIFGRYTVPDFRATNVLRAGDFPGLKPLKESGEIESGTFGESKEQLAVSSYGVMLSITRQMLINDQLGAIDQVLSSAGVRVADWENQKAFATLLANPALLTDSTAVYHAAKHGNLATAGTKVNVAANIGAGRAAMAKQTTLDGLKANFQPRYLLVSPDAVMAAEQLLAAVTPAKTTDAVPESIRQLVPISDPNLTGWAWYLFADPAIAPCFLYGYLEGFEAPRLSSMEEFNVQGIRVKLEHDFGTAAIDYRGTYKDPGADPNAA